MSTLTAIASKKVKGPIKGLGLPGDIEKQIASTRVQTALKSHASKMKKCIEILDSPDKHTKKELVSCIIRTIKNTSEVYESVIYYAGHPALIETFRVNLDFHSDDNVAVEQYYNSLVLSLYKKFLQGMSKKDLVRYIEKHHIDIIGIDRDPS